MSSAIAMVNDSVRHPLLHFVSQGARWVNQDHYPSHLEGADEHERWLEFIKRKGELTRFLPRLRDRANQHDEALAEIGVGYFLEKQCGLPIVGWEPSGANGKTGEYLTACSEGGKMFVEVKARGWEEEVVWTEGPNSQRLSRPKFIHAEARATAPWRSVRQAVKKAYPKMPSNMPTLLVICDDLFVALISMPINIEIALYCPRGAGSYSSDGDYLGEDGCFVDSRYEYLGAVAALNIDFPLGHSQARFRFRLYDNPKCLPAVAVPQKSFAGYHRFSGASQ